MDAGALSRYRPVAGRFTDGCAGEAELDGVADADEIELRGDGLNSACARYGDGSPWSKPVGERRFLRLIGSLGSCTVPLVS